MYYQLIVKPLFVSFLSLSVITGVLYPLFVTTLGSMFLNKQVSGSLVVKEGKIVGSELIGQSFTSDKYFWSRPSATSPIPYNSESSSGSNLSPSNSALIERVDKLVNEYNVDSKSTIPLDLVTASGSGLDPHISYEAAILQIQRVAGARSISAEKVKNLIDENVEGGMFKVVSPKRINVLKLNMVLDAESERR